MVAEPGPIALEAPPGEWPLRVVWDPALAPGAPGDGPDSAWRAETELDWERAEALLLVSALFEDGQAIALAALRPRGARGHDHDQVLHRLESDGDPVAVTEALVSSEYDADGHLRRIGAELWIDPSSPPLRLAADRRGEAEMREEDGVRREVTAMSFRLDGTSGAGACELLRHA
jgi:hypothetical protein